MYKKAKDAGVGRFVLMSTIMAVGPHGSIRSPITETTEPRPNEPYGESKLMAERFLLEQGAKDGIEIMIIRPPVIYGEGMSDRSSAMRTFASIKRGILPLVEDGKHTFNMLYVGNLSEAITLVALGLEARPGIYNVNEGPYTLKEIVSSISEEMGIRRGYIPVPKPLFHVISWTFESLSPFFKGPPPLSMTKYKALTSDVWKMDHSKIRKELDYTPPYTLSQGIGNTCRFYGWTKE
jgi:UDP-glucose 4-epimerase